MKKTMIILMAASLFAASVPAMAMDHGAMNNSTQMDEQCQKECDMLIKNCAQEVDSIQQRIQKLQTALQSKGNTYTRDQLKKLQQNLEDAQTTLVNIQRGGA